jgi:hypothetical protein
MKLSRGGFAIRFRFLPLTGAPSVAATAAGGR